MSGEGTPSASDRHVADNASIPEAILGSDRVFEAFASSRRRYLIGTLLEDAV